LLQKENIILVKENKFYYKYNYILYIIRLVMSLENFKKLMNDSIKFYNIASEYRKNGELDGALINYKLSAQGLQHSKMIVSDPDKNFKDLIKGKEGKIFKTWCKTKCDKIDGVLAEILGYIQPLQKELINRKSMMGRGDDETSFEDIQEYQMKGNTCIFFDDIRGLDKIKELMKTSIINPLLYPKLYPEMSKGVLLYGLPGTGKTFLVKAIANELQIQSNGKVKVLLFTPTGADFKGKYVGETEKNIRNYFKAASEKAKECKLDDMKSISILFIDEVDSIARDRNKDPSGMSATSVNALLQELEIQLVPKLMASENGIIPQVSVVEIKKPEVVETPEESKEVAE